MCGSMADIQSAAAEIRRGIKKRKKIEDDRKKPQGKNIMSASATRGGHNNSYAHNDQRDNPGQATEGTTVSSIKCDR